MDNLKHSFKLHPENGILIKSFDVSQSDDKCLKNLTTILRDIANSRTNDVRKSIALHKTEIDFKVSYI